MSFSFRIAAALPLACVALFVACNSRDDGFTEAPQLVGDPDAGGDAPLPPSCAGKRCSRDLHSVVDGCTDAVITTCAEGLGCSEGACVPACDSAAKAQGSIGCSFWAAPPDVLIESESSCFAAFVANTWDTPITLSAELGSDPLDVSQSVYRAIPKPGRVVEYERIVGPIPKGEVGVVFLAQAEKTPDRMRHVACPDGVTVAYKGVLAKEHTTSLYKAFHLKTSAPVSAYTIFPYGGAKSFTPAATLLTPSTSWDTSYLLVDAWRYQYRPGLGYPFVQIVAQEDTEVRLRPKVTVLDGINVPGGAKDSILKWNIKRGEVLELMQAESLAGSAIETTKPVGLFGGNQCAYVPDDFVACDTLHQQIPPVRQWSSAYSAVPYPSRRQTIANQPKAPESVTWQIMGASDGTVVTYSPSAPLGAPTTLAAGQRAFFATDQYFSVKSQDPAHPIYLAVYMSGAEQYSSLGDPDFVNVVPDDQFLDHYAFLVDHTYADSALTVVRRKDINGDFHDVIVDCNGPVTGWQPLATDGTTEFAWVQITRGGLDAKTPIGTCTYGRHEATSDGPFALYVWGMDDYASYGFPAGTGSRPTSPFNVVVR